MRKGGKVTTWELPDIQLRKLFATVDADGGGSVSIEELKDFVWGGETEPEPEPQRAAPSAGSGSASARRAQWLAGCWLHWVAPGEGALARNEHGAKTLGVIAHGPDGNGQVVLLLEDDDVVHGVAAAELSPLPSSDSTKARQARAWVAQRWARWNASEMFTVSGCGRASCDGTYMKDDVLPGRVSYSKISDSGRVNPGVSVWYENQAEEWCLGRWDHHHNIWYRAQGSPTDPPPSEGWEVVTVSRQHVEGSCVETAVAPNPLPAPTLRYGGDGSLSAGSAPPSGAPLLVCAAHSTQRAQLTPLNRPFRTLHGVTVTQKPEQTSSVLCPPFSRWSCRSRRSRRSSGRAMTPSSQRRGRWSAPVAGSSSSRRHAECTIYRSRVYRARSSWMNYQ